VVKKEDENILKYKERPYDRSIAYVLQKDKSDSINYWNN
jgi:hypothetical protein